MKLKKIALGLLAILAIAGTAGWFSLDKETRGLLATVPTNRDLLFWSLPQRDAAFRALDRIPLLAKWRVVQPSATPMSLPQGAPLKLPVDVEAFMAGQRSAALLIVHDGKLRSGSFATTSTPRPTSSATTRCAAWRAGCTWRHTASRRQRRPRCRCSLLTCPGQR